MTQNRSQRLRQQGTPPEQYAEITPTTDENDRLLLVVQERHGDGHRVHALSSGEPLEEYNDILERHEMRDGTISWGSMTAEEQDAVVAERDLDVALDDVRTEKIDADA